MIQKIDLTEKRELIQRLGKELFDWITTLPKEIRPDDKVRTGIQIVAREIGTRNIVMVPIYEPSEAARFFAVEKTVRTECHGLVTSEDSEDPGCMQFKGNVSYVCKNDSREFHVSTSGLFGEEDVLVSIIILSRIMGKSTKDIIKRIKELGWKEIYGKLPEQLFDKKHYINAILKEYK